MLLNLKLNIKYTLYKILESKIKSILTRLPNHYYYFITSKKYKIHHIQKLYNSLSKTYFPLCRFEYCMSSHAY